MDRVFPKESLWEKLSKSLTIIQCVTYFPQCGNYVTFLNSYVTLSAYNVCNFVSLKNFK